MRDDDTFELIDLPPDAGVYGHSHVLDALRQLLADGVAHTCEDLRDRGVALKLLPPKTETKYVRNALRSYMDRQAGRGEKPEFLELADGRFRLNVPVDKFAGHKDLVVVDPELDAFIARLRSDSQRLGADSAGDDVDDPVGAAFERDVAEAFTRMGFLAVRRGGRGEPDVVATAPMGEWQYTVCVECKTVGTEGGHQAQAAFAAEAAKMRDLVSAQYALMVGPKFFELRGLDAGLATHQVALWTVDDLEELLQTNAHHPVAWPDLVPLFAPGRRADDVSAFCFEHLNGAWKKAHVVLSYLLSEGLAYQISVAPMDSQVDRPHAPLTAEVLTVLVNQRMEHEGDLARANLEDVRIALLIASHPPLKTVQVAADGSVIVVVARNASMPTIRFL